VAVQVEKSAEALMLYLACLRPGRRCCPGSTWQGRVRRTGRDGAEVACS